MQINNILSWEELNKFKNDNFDRVNGLTNAYTNLRLFNKDEVEAKLIFYRDRHAWCPYCQKIWLWLEFKEIPYKIKKINMYCYGEKEQWYLNKVPSGKLPAIELNGEIVTESDQILSYLEKEYGILGNSIYSNTLKKARIVERDIFRAWCEWLCRNTYIPFEKGIRKNNLIENLHKFETLLKKSDTGYIDPIHKDNCQIIPGTGDIIFIPYIERINASICYYKGFSIREEFPFIDKWLTNLENQTNYLGTQGDFHTHSHDLPPQMGGCFTDTNEKQIHFSNLIDKGVGLGKLELNNKIVDTDYYSKFALSRVVKHKENIIRANPSENNIFDIALRSALTFMIHGKIHKPNNIPSSGLRYLRDRISVPRDMTIISARVLRQSLERIAELEESNEIYEIPIRHRYDQNPANFN
tara:strand:+ start:236 stop:1468 length:1233 start_codon:yes stop_codon:yes gene_type:complete